MKPIDQDIFVDDPQGRIGNCLQAAVASILELELKDVPHFGENDEWYKNLFKWLWDNGYSCYDVNTIVWHTGYVIACGISPRGHQHAVIYYQNELCHDPHPSNGGIDKPNHYYIIGKQP